MKNNITAETVDWYFFNTKAMDKLDIQTYISSCYLQ